jgi:WD40 repeat protein
MLSSPSAPRIDTHTYILAFSNHSQQVAYGILNDYLEIWVGDVRMEQVDRAWADENLWFGADFNEDALDIHWGPGDQWLILDYSDDIWAAVSLTTGEAVQLSGPCRILAVSPASGRPAAWCQTTTSGYVILEQDGSAMPDAPSPTEPMAQAQDWVFSPDGNRVLFADESGTVQIYDPFSQNLSLFLIYYPPPWDINMRTLQWSRDGKQVFVFGSDQRMELCLIEGTPNYCWFLFDSYTGEVDWWTRLGQGDATLSPDAEWVVMFEIREGMQRVGFVLSIETGEEFQIYDWLATAVYWGD